MSVSTPMRTSPWSWATPAGTARRTGSITSRAGATTGPTVTTALTAGARTRVIAPTIVGTTGTAIVTGMTDIIAVGTTTTERKRGSISNQQTALRLARRAV